MRPKKAHPWQKPRRLIIIWGTRALRVGCALDNFTHMRSRDPRDHYELRPTWWSHRHYQFYKILLWWLKGFLFGEVPFPIFSDHLTRYHSVERYRAYKWSVEWLNNQQTAACQQLNTFVRSCSLVHKHYALLILRSRGMNNTGLQISCCLKVIIYASSAWIGLQRLLSGAEYKHSYVVQQAKMRNGYCDANLPEA
jgi:hypothetical protein